MSTMGYAPAKPTLGSSFRAELYGLLAALVLLYETITFQQIQVRPGTTITIYIDNKSVGQRVNKHQRTPIRLGQYVSADMDIEITILEEMKKVSQLGLRLLPIRHVKAHQDKYIPYHQLTREAQLNIMADELATIARQESTIQSNDYDLPDPVLSMLFIKDQPITSKYQECIKEAYLTQPLATFYTTKFQWKQDTFNCIHWDSFERAIKKLSNSDRQRIQKYCVNRLHTNVREKYFHPHCSDLCPSCSICIETHDHILRCTTPSRQQLLQVWETEIIEHLTTDHTPAMLRGALLLGIKAWINDRNISNDIHEISDITPEAVDAFHEQSRIGWGQLTRGKISKKWIALVQQHLNRNNITQQQITATQWATNLITRIWRGVLNMWDLRNKECHGHDSSTTNTKEKEKLLHEAEYLQQTAKNAGHYDIHWLNKSRQELEGYPVLGLKAWVRNARTISRLYYQEMKTKSTSNQICEANLNFNHLYGGGNTVNSNVSTGVRTRRSISRS